MLASNPYWYRIIDHFERNSYVQNGLTIPFLIGGRKYVEPNSVLLTISELINEMNECGCTILKCDYIGEFVIGTIDTTTRSLKDQYYRSFDNIVVTDSSLDHINDTAGLIQLYTSLYQQQINKEHYSKNDGVWSNYSDVDCKRLKEVQKSVS